MRKKLCVNFSMSAGPFKQTGLGGGHQTVVSHCTQPLLGRKKGKFTKINKNCMFILDVYGSSYVQTADIK